MAVIKLYFRIFTEDDTNIQEFAKGKGIVRIDYDDEQHKIVGREVGVGNHVTYGDGGKSYPDNQIHTFLNRDSYTANAVKPAGSDLYLQIDGEVIYRVVTQTNFPNALVKVEFYEPLEAEIYQLDNVSEFGLRDGLYKFHLKKGSGYVYDERQRYSPNAVATKLPGLSPGEFRGDQNLPAGTFSQVARDALTLQQITIEATITEPPCTLLIDEVVTTPESAPGGNDGTITVTATSDNPIEYKLEAGAWQDSNEFTGLTDGQYTLYVRDKNQNLCAQERPVDVEELPCDLVIQEVKLLHESARGRADGRLTILASSDRAIEYAIRSDGEQQTPYQDTNIFADLPSGTHEVYARLKAANTCFSSDVILIKEGPDYTANIDNVSCGNAPTGRIQITLADNSYPAELYPLTYLWEDGSTEPIRENVKPGDYTVAITSADGRTNEFTFTVTGQPPIVITATVDQGEVFLSVSGGTAPYTFLWSDGVTGQNRQGLDPDTYTVTVTDATGCSKQENIFVRIPQHYFSENKIALEVFAFDLDIKPNFTYVCEIYLEEDYLSDEFSLIGTLEHSVDDEGKTVFEVNDYLDAYLEPVLPDVNAGLVRLEQPV